MSLCQKYESIKTIEVNFSDKFSIVEENDLTTVRIFTNEYIYEFQNDVLIAVDCNKDPLKKRCCFDFAITEYNRIMNNYKAGQYLTVVKLQYTDETFCKIDNHTKTITTNCLIVADNMRKLYPSMKIKFYNIFNNKLIDYPN